VVAHSFPANQLCHFACARLARHSLDFTISRDDRGWVKSGLGAQLYPGVIEKWRATTRFERVTFAFGGQRLFYVANRGAICSTNHKNRVLRAGFEPARKANHHNLWLHAFRCWPICLAPIP
jgi:hypothetical protein